MEENVSVDFAELAPRVGLLVMEKWILEIRLARLLEAQNAKPPPDKFPRVPVPAYDAVDGN